MESTPITRQKSLAGGLNTAAAAKAALAEAVDKAALTGQLHGGMSASARAALAGGLNTAAAAKAALAEAVSLRPELLQGWMQVRDNQQALEALASNSLSRSWLPRSRAIGEQLRNLKAQYGRGVKGSPTTAAFYEDAAHLTGMSRATAARHTWAAEHWEQIVDTLAVAQEPITSRRALMEALRSKAEKLALTSDVMEEALDGPPQMRQVLHATRAREAVVSAIEQLLASPTGRKHAESLRVWLDDGRRILDALELAEAQEARAIPGTVGATAPQPESDREPDPTERVSLATMFPSTAEGLEALEAAIVEAGSGGAFARDLGLHRSSVNQHRQRIRKALEEA
jgi:hypothetical protein